MAIIVKAIKCSKCLDLIYSRSQHDFHKCTCGSLAIDGGFETLRILSLTEPSTFTGIENLTLNTTKEQLYEDWNESRDKYGWYKKV